jgi:hypothetical protein
MHISRKKRMIQDPSDWTMLVVFAFLLVVPTYAVTECLFVENNRAEVIIGS